MMSKNKFLLLCWLLMIFSISGAWKSGKYAGSFLMNPIGSRATSLGGAYTAIAEDASAIFWNPAGLTQIHNMQLIGMHSERFAGMVNIDFIAGSFAIQDRASIGLGYLRLGVDDIPSTRLQNETELVSGTNRPYVEKYLQDDESAFFITYSKNIASRIWGGINIKILRKTMGNYSAWGLGFDTGFLYLPTKSLKLGITVQDVTSTMIAWHDGIKEQIFPQLKLGTAYSKQYKQFNFLTSLDLANMFYKDPAAQMRFGNMSSYIHLGTEVSYMNKLSLRAGSFRGDFTTGIGLNIGFTTVDYCFLKHTDLGDSHLISLTLHRTKPPH